MFDTSVLAHNNINTQETQLCINISVYVERMRALKTGQTVLLVRYTESPVIIYPASVNRKENKGPKKKQAGTCLHSSI